MNRADRMLEVLVDGEPHSRAELHAAGGYYMTNNAAAELRDRGYTVAQHVRVIAGHKTYFYRLTALPEAEVVREDAASASGSAGSQSAKGTTSVPSVVVDTTPSGESGPLTPPVSSEATFEQLSLEAA